MKPSLVLLERIDAVREIVARYPVSNLRLFGSAARGSDTDASDLDLLVDAAPDATLFDLGGLQDELQEVLGVSVDLRTPQDISARYRHEVASEARPL